MTEHTTVNWSILQQKHFSLYAHVLEEIWKMTICLCCFAMNGEETYKIVWWRLHDVAVVVCLSFPIVHSTTRSRVVAGVLYDFKWLYPLETTCSFQH